MSTAEMKQQEEKNNTTSTVNTTNEPLRSESPFLTNGVQSTISASPDQVQSSEAWMSSEHSGMSSLELNAAAALCSQRPNKKGSKKHSPAERLQRSRERNRMHARKTRQRKKEQMQTLQGRVEDLKQEQIRLKQSINEKQTASILVRLFSTEAESQRNTTQNSDPVIEELLVRPSDEIPDSTKIPELPALILPGNHKKSRASIDSSLLQTSFDSPNDGIDYDLLGKDRSKCSAEELDRIRRERNRMHAKRTRDRKRIFMDQMEEMCKKLESENTLLRNHLTGLDGDGHSTSESRSPFLVSPTLVPSVPSMEVPDVAIHDREYKQSQYLDSPPNKKDSQNHLTKLLEVAGSFCNFGESRAVSSIASAVSASTDTSVTESGPEDQDENFHTGESPRKRRRMESSSGVPSSITTS